FWNGDLFWRVAANTVALIAAVSFFKIRALSASADSVVLGLGGHLLDPNASDPHQRRLLNVVEEMAIASGVPVPAVYLLPDEPGINALAVGLDASRSAIAVTDGCLKVLSRDELQGVIAHEFSHLLNGDSKINLRLLGLVHGILVIGLIGSRILRSFGRSSSSESRRKVNPGGLGVIVIVGVALYLIGSIGLFFTRPIRRWSNASDSSTRASRASCPADSSSPSRSMRRSPPWRRPCRASAASPSIPAP